MTTSQTSCTARLLELGDKFPGLILALGHAAPAGHDPPVVAQPDPSAGHADAMGMHNVIHSPLGADRSISSRIPSHKDLVIPEAKFPAPKVTALLDGPSTSKGFGLDQLA